MPKIQSLKKIPIDCRQIATLSTHVTKKGQTQYLLAVNNSTNPFSSLDKLHNYLLKQQNVDTWEIHDLSDLSLRASSSSEAIQKIIYMHRSLNEIETFNSERELNSVLSKENNGAWKVEFVVTNAAYISNHSHVIPSEARDLPGITTRPYDHYVIDQSGWFSADYRKYSLEQIEEFLAASAAKKNQQEHWLNWNSWGMSLLSVSALISNSISTKTENLSELSRPIFAENYPIFYSPPFTLGTLVYALTSISDLKTPGLKAAAFSLMFFLEVKAQAETANHPESFLDDRASQVSTSSFYADVLNPKIRIKIITLTDGNFTIIWQDQELRSYCRYINADGIFLSPQFNLSNTPSLFDAASLFATTEFIVAQSPQIQSNNNSVPSMRVLSLQRFNFEENNASYSLEPIGKQYDMAEFNISDHDAVPPLITRLPFKEDLVTGWLSYSSKSASYEILGRCCGYNCLAGSPFRINNATLIAPVSPSMAALSPSNNFTVVWSDLSNIYLGNYAQNNPTCSSSYPEERKFYSSLSTPSPVLTSANLSANGLAIIWAGKDKLSGNLGIFGLQIQDKGIALGGDFKVSNNSSRQNTFPATASFSGDYEDYFMVIWVSRDSKSVGNATMLHGRFFRVSPNISPVTEEFIISNNTAPLALQKNYYPAVESLPSNKVVISWYGGVNNTYFVYARIFELNKLLPPKPDDRLIVGIMGSVVLVSLVGGIVYHCKNMRRCSIHKDTPLLQQPTHTVAGIAGGTQTFNGTVIFDVTGGRFEIAAPSAARETASQQTNVQTQKRQKFQTTQPNQGAKTMPKHLSLKIAADNRPPDREYAVLSNHVYGGNKLKKGDVPVEAADWKVQETKSEGQFFGAIYKHKRTNQVIVAYRGTQSIGDLIEDLRGIFNNQELSPYKEAAFELTQTAIGLAEDAESSLSFTGHSLGAYLAELSVYYCHAYYPQKKAQAAQAAASAAGEDDDNDADVDDKVGNVVSAVSEFDIRESVHAVTFESPGTRDVMEKLQSQLDAGRIDLTQLDILTYLSYPNLVNTCNQHVGTAYSFEPEISGWSNVPGWHLKQVHSMSNIVALFNNAAKHYPVRHFMLDWPQGGQRAYYFQNVRLEGKKYTWTKPADELAADFKLLVGGRFRIDQRLGDWKMIPLRHFTRSMQDWLESFYPIMIKCSRSDVFLKQAEAAWKEAGIPSHIIGYLLSCVLVKEKEKGTAYLSIESENVEQTGAFIRKELSRWLSETENADKADKLLETIQTLQARPDIQVALAGPGGRITGGAITKTKLQGVFVDIPPDTDPQMLEYFKQVSKYFLQTLKKSGVTIGTYLVAGGGVLENVTMSDIELTAVKFQVGANPQVGGQQRVIEKDLSSSPAVDAKQMQTSSPAKLAADQFARLNQSAPSSFTSSSAKSTSATATSNATAEEGPLPNPSF